MNISRAPQAHRDRLTTLKAARVDLKPLKRAFYANRIKYLSSVIQRGRLEGAIQTTDRTHELKKETTVTEIQFISGVCYVIRSFVVNVRIIASSSSRRLKKTQAKDLRPLEENELHV